LKAALIPPISALRQFARGDFHLILSHLLKDRRYEAHYARLRRKGAYLVLDNSAHEHGAGDAPLILADQAAELNAQEVVVPDVLFDAGETVKRAIEAHEAWFEGTNIAMRDPDLRLMYVPQGRTRAEWAVCFQELVRMHLYTAKIHRINQTFVIGVSKDYEEWSGGLNTLLGTYVLPMKDNLHAQGIHMSVHLLGWGRDLWELGRLSRAYPWIRSIDSAKPFVYAIQGIQLNPGEAIYPYPGRPENYFDAKMGVKHYERARHNVEVFRKLAKG